MRGVAVQHVPGPARLYYMRIDFAGVLPMFGVDVYRAGHGRMHGQPVSQMARVRGTVSAWPSTEHKVRQWPDRLEEAAEHPEWLGSAHLVGGPPREVDQRSHGKGQFHGSRGDDQPLLGAC